jgi:hypothetical protein
MEQSRRHHQIASLQTKTERVAEVLGGDFPIAAEIRQGSRDSKEAIDASSRERKPVDCFPQFASRTGGQIHSLSEGTGSD